ncbi:hypothetical protein [Hymenobacter metallicola]|uniref:Uncharacterized protein n=1 Tax=Hymenobacter metallicola TaxID=2563114 RepID=A0A4Z0Q0F2_9BACT|nr:hypothetical protein [Hymenobacter metallicola]TGE23508.1 hypothetical protein E5K02_20185 [Hymenobacter metallicola]
MSNQSTTVCHATIVFRRWKENKIHCRLFKWEGLKPGPALNEILEQDGLERRRVRVTIEVLPEEPTSNE